MRHTLLATAVAVATLGLVAAPSASAGEGMWVPQQLPQISAELKKAGLKIDAKQMANLTGDPLGAVVSLGGCTASFVSPNGLVATNHHCAYGAIQLNSTKEKNLITEGFNAAALGDELSAGPNSRIYVLEEITDVTERMRAAIRAESDPLARTRAAEDLEKKLVSECEAPGGYRCRVYNFMGGNQYRLFKNLEIKDVRLAYAPPAGIGNYGGEVDNWMWPRHTGDFSFIRAYVGKDGKPAAYAKDNVPYQPKHWLRLADKPLREGDFVMAAGYPGVTARYALADEFAATAGWRYPTTVRHYTALRDMVHAAGAKDADIDVKYAATVKGWENTLKNNQGQIEGFQRMGATAIKQTREAEVLAWLRSRGAQGAEALKAHDTLVALNQSAQNTRDRDFIFPSVGGALTGVASRLYRLSIERTKPDAQRESGYQQRDLPGIEGSLKELDRRYAPAMDAQLMRYWLTQYVALPKDQRVPALDQWLGGSDAKTVDAAVARLQQSKLGDLAERTKWLNADRTAFESSTDPAIQLAVTLMPTRLQMEQDGKRRAGEMVEPRATYLQAVADYNQSHGRAVYPDANSSLRITFGHVKGYTRPDGAKQAAFTRLEEVAAKATGQEPFDAPQKQLDAIKAKRYAGMADAKLGTVPVNFMADLDITGGNSGSPVMDANGRLVGLLFDMNWESVASNWVFNPDLTRTIVVDQRYIRWVMQEVMPSPRLLREMNVAPVAKKK